jgi:hypothetical protein
MPEQPLEPELIALEQSLGQLEPAARLAREQLFFKAGRASARRPWAWPAATGLSTLTAVVLGLLLWRQSIIPPTVEIRKEFITIERTVPVPSELPLVDNMEVLKEEPGIATSAQDYLKLRQGVVRWGADALHAAPPQMTTQERLTPADVPRLSPPQSGASGFFRFIPFSSGGDS